MSGGADPPSNATYGPGDGPAPHLHGNERAGTVPQNGD